MAISKKATEYNSILINSSRKTIHYLPKGMHREVGNHKSHRALLNLFNNSNYIYLHSITHDDTLVPPHKLSYTHIIKRYPEAKNDTFSFVRYTVIIATTHQSIILLVGKTCHNYLHFRVR